MFEENEKQMIKEALSLYIQYVGQQLPQNQIEQLADVIKGIYTKLDTEVAQDGSTKPAGITDEWYESVCQNCDKLSNIGCEDPVTKKFPGKCDPILKFEMEKIRNK
jgi:hypothetical protein